ncbi:diguanylate cyclase (GGDEF)-like protein/PAS domain S-box-containing protein [Desulfitispora alkaliphila]|uniref:diguanylate cyclase domain-containing protein n=1 Tax=Desulfitispora alkaliphila TaxID=622674 RepID=UPI003D1B58D3
MSITKINEMELQIINKLNIGIIVLDRDFRVVIWNDWLEQLSGRLRDQVIGEKITTISPVFNKRVYQHFFNDALEHGKKMFCSATLHPVFIAPLNKSGCDKKTQQNLHIEPIDFMGEQYILLQIYDITYQHKRIHVLKNALKEMESSHIEAKNATKKLLHKAYHDPLTGLPNRLMLNHQLKEYMSNHVTGKIAVLFLDLDDFAIVNNRLGHMAGDNLLKQIAQRLTDTLRRDDIVARYGGDEFVIVLPNISNPNDVYKIAQKLVEVIREPIELESENVKVSGSIGISLYPDHGDNIHDLLKNADAAMYRAKSDFKDCYRFLD